jgi:hypothetical protein
MATLAEWAALKYEARKDELYEAQIQELSKRQDTHSLDTDKVVRSLKDKPKAKAAIWYVRDDTESYALAGQINNPLGSGAGWSVTEPEPIPEQGGDPRFQNAPACVRFGPGLGVGMLVQKLDYSYKGTQDSLLHSGLRFPQERALRERSTHHSQATPSLS